MNTLATRISTWIKKSNPEQTHSIEVMKYSLGIMLNTLFVFVVSLLLGFITGTAKETLIFIFAFISLRVVSGGFHFKSAWACNIVSILIFTVTPHFAYFSSNTLLIIDSINLLLMIMLSPKPDTNTQIPLHWYSYLKIASILLVLLNFLLNSPVIGLAFLAQSITIIATLKRRRDNLEKKSS